MYLSLTEDQSLLLEQIAAFAKGQLAPLCMAWRDQEESAQAALPLLIEQGLMGCCVPETEGGPGLDPFVLCHGLAALAHIDASLATQAAILNGAVIEFLLHHDHSPQRNDRLHSILTEQHWVAWVSEQTSDHPVTTPIQANTTTDGWSLQGSVQHVTFGVSAHVLLVFANDEQNQRRAFWIKANTPGIERQVVRGKLGLRYTDVAHIRFHAVEIQADQEIHTAPNTQLAEMYSWQKARITLAAVALGVAQIAHQHACQYAQQRKQFGSSLSSFQAIQWKIADRAMDIEAATHTLNRALFAWQTESTDALASWANAVTALVAHAATKTTEDALQIHGGYGFTKEFPVERFYRDAQTLRSRWLDPKLHTPHHVRGSWYCSD